jgi:predicted  nucleic acid-binding Zn-ribbon protein
MSSTNIQEIVMGIFGDDKRQDERLDALENHIRDLTQSVQTNQADLAETRITLLGLQANVDDKVSAADVDPAIVKLNEDLATARQELEQASAAASESWAELQGGVNDAFERLRTSTRAAVERLKSA